MKSVCAIVLVLISSVAFGQGKHSTKKKAVEKPVILSSWIRHAGLQYLELVDKSLHATNYEVYEELLDNQERSLKIDAQGADKVFVEKVLTQVRYLEISKATLRSMDKSSIYRSRSDKERLEYAGLTVEASHYIHCKGLAETMIDTGEAQAFGECSYKTIALEVENASAAETERMRIEQIKKN